MLNRLFFVASIRLKEAVRYSCLLRTVKAMLLTLRGLLSRDPAVRLCWLCRAYVLAEHSFLWEPLACAISKACQGQNEVTLDWRRTPNAGWYHNWLAVHRPLTRTTVTKAPGPNGEKGVILSYFEYNWFLLMEDPDTFRALCADYHLILTSSWAPTDYHLLAQALVMAPNATLWLMPCNLAERQKAERFHPRLKALNMMPCDWLNPAFFPQKDFATRDIDLLIVSNWAPFKRHWALFNALRDLPASLRVVCVGQPEAGYTKDHIRKLQALMGAPQNIEFLERLPIEQVSALQCRARLGLILSLWEGCCVSAAEALMAGSPLAMCKDAHVGPHAYVNERTGFHLSRVPKAREIARALVECDQMEPRVFAEARVSHLRSSATLNAVLKAHDTSLGFPWTLDLVPLFWRPYPKIASMADHERLAPAYQALVQRFPNLFPADLLHVSHE